jgi:hypothetical protein
MDKLKGLLLVSSGIAIVAMTLSLTDVGHVVAQAMKPLLVTVVNTAADPVPVTDNVAGTATVTSGTVNVGNFPVTQNIAGEAGVRRAGDAELIADAGERDRGPATTNVGGSVR